MQLSVILIDPVLLLRLGRWTFLVNFGVVLVLALIGVVLGLSLLTIGVISTDAWEVLLALA